MEKLNRIIKEEISGFVTENDNERLADYFVNTWSKDENLRNKITNNNLLRAKYGSYLTYSEEEWKSMSYDDLMQIWNAWDADEMNY